MPYFIDPLTYDDTKQICLSAIKTLPLNGIYKYHKDEFIRNPRFTSEFNNKLKEIKKMLITNEFSMDELRRIVVSLNFFNPPIKPESCTVRDLVSMSFLLSKITHKII